MMGCTVGLWDVFTTSRRRSGEYDTLAKTGRSLVPVTWLAEQRDTGSPLAWDDLRQQRAVSAKSEPVTVRGGSIRLRECPFSDGG